jgi:hypothetical protein
MRSIRYSSTVLSIVSDLLYLCNTFLNLRRSMFYFSSLPKGLYRSESITSTAAFSPHIFQSYVLVRLPLCLFTWHSALVGYCF